MDYRNARGTPGRRCGVGSKWVSKTKLGPDGTTRFKGVKGIEVSRLASYRILLQWKIDRPSYARK